MITVTEGCQTFQEAMRTAEKTLNNTHTHTQYKAESNKYPHYWRNVAYPVTHEQSWCDLKNLFSAVMGAIRFVTFWKQLRKYWSSICFLVLGILLTAITQFQLSRSGVRYSIHKHLPPHTGYRLRGGNLQRKTAGCRACYCTIGDGLNVQGMVMGGYSEKTTAMQV